MPGMPAPIRDEREGLLSFLAQQRFLLCTAAHGLTDAEARLTPSASSLSVGGLIKHLTSMERNWIDMIEQRRTEAEPGDDLEERTDDYLDGFRLGDHQTLAQALAAYQAVAAETERVIATIDDLGRAVPVPQGVPWFPADVEAWSVRWVLLHLIEETARHAGHADIVRESIDGADAISLLAAAEQWPASEWVQPWARQDLASSNP
jgi:uncharacterized damage-inducible protein DinB